jgi:hypothetical protein
MPKALPAKPNLAWLRKAAKHRLVALRAHDPEAKLTATINTAPRLWAGPTSSAAKILRNSCANAAATNRGDP